MRTRPNIPRAAIRPGWADDPEHFARLITGLPDTDEIRLDPLWRRMIRRRLHSQDGVYDMDIAVYLCDSPQEAENVLHLILSHWQSGAQRGTFTSSFEIGDESFVGQGIGTSLICRSGSLIVGVEGESSFVLREDLQQPFPPAAVEAAAYQVLLAASRQAKLTGISAHEVHVAVNGKVFAKDAIIIGKQVYVPVAEFAKAMGYVTRWDAKTGQLALSGAARKPVTLTADSAKASVGGASVALTTPVLKQGGQPVMTLQDLLTLVQGRITRQDGNDIQVTV